MRFVSLNSQETRSVDLATALLEGLAPDGGLYMPEALPSVPRSVFDSPPSSMAQVGINLLRPFLAEVPEADAERLITEAFDFEVPLVELEEGIHILELFHGPTLAFKDVAARFLARFLGWFSRDDGRTLTVLVATSGDTGSAVAQAFLGVPGTRVVVLYPQGKVSPLQEKQFTTLGENVQALAVDGTFDDCQDLVKEAFVDEELRTELFLTSANSINIGRLLPQMVYYVHGLAGLRGQAAPVVSVPSGNFGNLTAGLLAKRLGLPVARFVASTNANDVVPRYLESGLYEPRPSLETLSNAMDVGAPSNFRRLAALYGDDIEAVRRDVTGARFDDEATRGAIADVYKRTGYVMDPHTAVGYLGLRQALAEAPSGTPGVVLATAHPVKFREHVEPLIGDVIDVPERLARCLEQPSLTTRIPPRLESLRGCLL